MITTSVNDICNEYPAQDRYLIEKFNSLMRIRVKRLGWYRDNLVPCLGRDFCVLWIFIKQVNDQMLYYLGGLSMDQINIQFPDGNSKAFDKGTTTEDIAQSISPGLRKKAVAGKFNGQMVDLTRPLEEDGSIEIVTPGSEEALEVLRHSTAHLMAQALKRLYGDVKFGVGPVIEGGFYYDFDMDEKVSSDDFDKIEKQ